MSKETIPAWAKGTLLDEILSFDATKKNAFPDTLPAMEKTDKKIGSMSDYEKVLCTLLDQKEKEFEEMVGKDHDPNNFDTTRELDRKIMKLKKETLILSKMMWASINYKIKTPGGDKTSLRKGFTIVHAVYTPEEAFRNAVSNLGGAVIMVGGI